MPGTGVRLTLLLLSALGFWTLWGFPYRNGLLDFLGRLSDPGATLPGSVYTPTTETALAPLMRQHYTGIKALDKQLTTLVGFFYTATDGNRIDVALTFLNLGSQVLAAWMLITLESYRTGNQGKMLFTSITLFGLSVALVGYACVAPIYFYLHLLLSKVARTPKEYNLIVQQPIQLALAPFATAIGFGIPSIMMALPAPSVLSYYWKQTWTALQQGWPIWILLAQRVLEAAVVSADPMSAMRTEKQKKAETLKYSRRAFRFALMTSTSAHLLYTGLSLVAAFAPSLLSSKLQVQLAPENFFIPPNPFSDLRARTLATGAMWFLQWDLIIGVLSTMIWGVAVELFASNRQDSLGAWIVSLLKNGLIALVVGPAGAAVLAIWRRDEAILKRKAD